ncbi:MAG: VWA domain-containing protein, partial [Deltaproteobacteria bacterium]|nr:VWA domain-containing protein [Deltaproteobacteria bacterium]
MTPTDILFVIDNTGSMVEEISKVQANVQLFIDEMSKSENQFQVGIITADTDCNVPQRNCGNNPPNCTGVGTAPLSSYGCCALTTAGPCTAAANCQDQDIAPNDSVYETSSCDGGRLRASLANRRVFERPSDAQRASWVNELTQVLGSTGSCGSPYEGAFEAALRAVACSANDDTYCPVAAVASDNLDCDNKRVRDLNRGFIRPNADLVLIFISDEDDCSARRRTYPAGHPLENSPYSIYSQPPDPNDPDYQAYHLCLQFECQAHYATPGETCGTATDCGNNGVGPNNLAYACNNGFCQFDADENGLINWADPNDPNTPLAMGTYTCSGNARQVNPPALDSAATYLDAFVAVKGDVSKVRAAAVVSTVADTNAPLGFKRVSACVNEPTFGVSDSCGCLSSSPLPLGLFFCGQTQAIGQQSTELPMSTGGCHALPSSRYMQFLEDLATRRAAAGEPVDTLADTICGGSYDQTMYKIVNQVILSSCFELGTNPGCAKNVSVTLNGEELPNVLPDSGERGWSLAAGASRVCL